MTTEHTEFFASCRVVRSARRRSIAIVLNASGEAELRVPSAATSEDLARAWTRFAPWLARKRRELAAVPPAAMPFAFDFHIGGHFFFLGQELELVHAVSPYGSQLIRLDGGRLLFPGHEPAAIVRHLEAFYRRQALRILTGKVERFSAQFQIAVGTVSIHGAERRYGSCSAAGDLNFSWQLMMYPEELIDLVVLHELSHRSEMNHSIAFYRVLKGYLPDFRKREKALREWGRKLSGYTAAAEKVRKMQEICSSGL